MYLPQQFSMQYPSLSRTNNDDLSCNSNNVDIQFNAYNAFLE